MILWFILAGLTIACLWYVLRPLFRAPSKPAPRAAYDREIYRDQLAEVARDEKRGVIAAAEARAAEREIARRLLAAAPAGSEAPAAAAEAAPGRMARRRAALGVATLVPLAAFGLYLLIGSPGVPDFPFAERTAATHGESADDIQRMVAQLEARLKVQPDDVDGWAMLGRSKAALERFDDARAAYAKAVSLTGGRPDLVSAEAEMMVMAGDGSVSAAAHHLFEVVLAKLPKDPRARFYLGLAKAQAGDGEGAIRDWLKLEADGPADAPWMPALKTQIERAAAQFKLDPAKLAPPGAANGAPSAAAPAAPGPTAPAPAAPGPTAAGPAAPGPAAPGPSAADMAAAQNMSAAERDKMIHSMVDNLAARLAKEPDDLDGWRRLARAYQVLGEHARSLDALSHAAKLAPKDEDVLAVYGNALMADAKPGEPPPTAAVEVMRQVLALDDKRAEALWVVGLDEAAHGHKQAAAGLWTKLLAGLSPGTPGYAEVKRHIDGLAQ